MEKTIKKIEILSKNSVDESIPYIELSLKFQGYRVQTNKKDHIVEIRPTAGIFFMRRNKFIIRLIPLSEKETHVELCLQKRRFQNLEADSKQFETLLDVISGLEKDFSQMEIPSSLGKNFDFSFSKTQMDILHSMKNKILRFEFNNNFTPDEMACYFIRVTVDDRELFFMQNKYFFAYPKGTKESYHTNSLILITPDEFYKTEHELETLRKMLGSIYNQKHTRTFGPIKQIQIVRQEVVSQNMKNEPTGKDFQGKRISAIIFADTSDNKFLIEINETAYLRYRSDASRIYQIMPTEFIYV